jgi:hypothetical protein
MNGSRTIRVVKRDGCEEPFEVLRLAAAMHRGMRHTRGTLYDAGQLAMAIEIYLDRTERRRVTSAAVFEMAVKVLRRVQLFAAAKALETHHLRRAERRRRLSVSHGGGRRTRWDKSWLAALAQARWGLWRSTARIVAGQVEDELLCQTPPDGAGWEATRGELCERLDACVSAYGLADAVPVERDEAMMREA